MLLWLKKYWLIVVGGVAYAAYMIFDFVRYRDDNKRDLAKLHARLRKITLESNRELEEHNKRMTDKRRRLAEIDQISNEARRLKALAYLANTEDE